LIGDIMSIIFGVRKPIGAVASEPELHELALATARYAPDGMDIARCGNVGMGFQAYYTHPRSRLVSGSIGDSQGTLVGFDGRLDNYHDLCNLLGLAAETASDAQITLTAFQRWGNESFSRLIGDWAIALWCARDQALYLARDHAGSRGLYFEDKNGTVAWSTYLDTFFARKRTFELDLDYATLYIANRPTRDLTPYKGVRGVPPAHYIVFQDNKVSAYAHWHWMRRTTVRYKTDGDYEEHLLDVLGPAVARRSETGGAPTIAHLSGGMDSTAIVCMSDSLRHNRDHARGLLDTLSFYDDSEPSLNDRPYFTLVESKRQKPGTHIRLSYRDRTFEPHDRSKGVYLLPGADSSTIDRERVIARTLDAGGYRTILTGMGGDEMLGGVPTGLPELATYLMTGNLTTLVKQGISWCIASRTTLPHLLFETVSYAFDLCFPSHADKRSVVPWMPAANRVRYANLVKHDVTTSNRIGLQPNSIENGVAWWSILGSLPHLDHRILSRNEYCYPLLDRDLVEYLFSLPREQLVRPGQRRSLMRRSLRGIVPVEILERRRKAFQLSAPLATIRSVHSRLTQLLSDPIIADYGIVDIEAVSAALELVQKGQEIRWWQGLVRVINFELWLRSMTASQLELDTHRDMLQPSGA
jgi:asparagine synthase (glutamine-hydrolysing)